MDLDIGPYRLHLPSTATVPAADEKPRPFRALPLVRIGAIDLHAILSDKTLQEWRDVVSLATRHRTQFIAIVVNGIPGFKLPPNDRRLDYAFQSDGENRIELMTWSDKSTTEEERQAVEAIIQTLHVRPRPTIVS